MRLMNIAGAATLLLGLGAGVADAQQTPVVINKIQLTGTKLAGDVLTATGGTITGTLAGLPFTTTIDSLSLDLSPAQATDCAILNLHLAPIHIELLGLHVDTSPICLDITAIPNGGLLGELLCDLSGLDLNGILGGLLGDLTDLGGDSALGTILTQVLGDALDSAQRQAQAHGNGNGNGHGNGNGNGHNGGGGGGDICTGDCEILHLVLGPVDLTLLGLNVVLDDCDNGPVEVCVSSTRSEGILGALLCSLAGPQLLGLDLGDITALVDLAQSLLNDGVLSNADILQLRQLLRQLLNA